MLAIATIIVTTMLTNITTITVTTAMAVTIKLNVENPERRLR